MGIYDQLAQLDQSSPAQTSTLRPPEGPKKGKTAANSQSPVTSEFQPLPVTTAPHDASGLDVMPDKELQPTGRPGDRTTGQPTGRSGDRHAGQHANRSAPPPAGQSGHTPAGQPPNDTAGRRSGHSTAGSGNLPYRRPRHRRIVRHGFELYQDQVDLLRHLSLEAKLTGDELSMSEMVREAIDEYFTVKNLRRGP